MARSKSQNHRPAKRSESLENAVTILTSGCHFSGKLYCRGSTRIGGIIEGEIASEGILVVEQDAHIKASIRAEEVIVHGRVEGTLEAVSRVELCSTGIFKGDILTPSLSIKEGAQFNGRSRMSVESAEVGHGGLKEDGYDPPEVKTELGGGVGKPSPDVSVL